MKTSLLLAAAFIATASLLSSCQQDGQSLNGPKMALPLSSSTPAANPALTYVYDTTLTVKKVGYEYFTISVMDSTGKNQTNVVTAADVTSSEGLYDPCWSPTGASICYRDVQLGAGGSILGQPCSINAFDVSVNGKGVPVASNARTIYSLTTSDSAYLLERPQWSATSSVGEIAFIREHTGSENGLSELCTISQSGGTVTVLASLNGLNGQGRITSEFYWPTWSPDDSKIAAVRYDTIGHATIMIYNSSTGAPTDSIPLASVATVNWLEWSRTGENELVWAEMATGSSGPTYIYYCAPSTGSMPSTNSLPSAYAMTWSPNNSSIMYQNTQTHVMAKNIPLTSDTTNVLNSFYGYYLNWKR